MKKIVNIFLVAVTLFAVASCQHNRKVSVKADFTTDKTVYELYEDIKVTNVSAATNDIIVACKWEWGSEHVYGKQLEKPISFDSVGEKEIKLTVTTDTGAQDVCVKTVTVQDTNVRPVADFEWTPTEGIAAGDEVQFTDKSTDADGTIVAWEWKFGANTVTEQNPKYAFPVFGDIEVTLTVTDNQRGKGSVKKVIHVAKSPNSLELAWAKAYDSTTDAYTKFTSPATNADGSRIYAFSSGLHLVAFDAEGNQKWSYDANQFPGHKPANPLTSGNKMNGSSCTPSVDKDGTIFVAVAYNEAKSLASESGVYAINPDGSRKWYFANGNAQYVNITPVILDEKIFLSSKSNPSQNDYPAIWEGKPFTDNGTILNKETGNFDQVVRVKRGSHGGFAATKEETILVHTDETYGTRLLWKENGEWKHYGSDGARDKFVLGYTASGTLSGQTTYMAIDGNNKVYVLYGKSNGGQGILFCYDLTKYSTTEGATPEWTLDMDGNTKRYSSHGVALGEDGTIYVTTANGLEAVNPDGTKKWWIATSGETFAIWGSPAVDNQGYIYFNEGDADETTGKLVKVKPDGTKASEIVLGTSLRTSPAISPDGTIYCTGMKDGKPTLFAVKGSATGAANSWSQMGGNSRKSCKAE